MEMKTTNVSYTGLPIETTLLQQLVIRRKARGERATVGRLIREAVIDMYGAEMEAEARNLGLYFVADEVAEKQPNEGSANNDR